MRRLPALVAAVTGDDGAVSGVQRTWLDPRSPAKAGVAMPRKALGRIYGLAVRFGRPADGASLLVGEGIETVLSLVTAVPEITAAAALSAGSLGAFAPPLGLTRLVIARDNDEEGEAGGGTPRPALRAGGRRRPGASSPKATTSTTTSLHSAATRSPRVSRRCSAFRSAPARASGSVRLFWGESSEGEGAWPASSI